MRKLLVTCLLLMVSSAFGETRPSPKWIGELNAAKSADQIVIVSGTHGSNARFSFHEKDDSGTWREIVSCPAYVGKNGWGKTREGDVKTPCGVFTFTKAFGILPDPGCPIGYTQVDDSHYWIGDSNSDRYNQFVSVNDYDAFDKKESEHIVDYVPAYHYCLNISYNPDGTPKKGNAIFLHCYSKKKYTGGCVAVPEDVMREVLRHVKSGCVVVMDTSKNIKSY